MNFNDISSIEVLQIVEVKYTSEQTEDDSFSNEHNEDLVIDNFCESYRCDDRQQLRQFLKLSVATRTIRNFWAA